MRASYEYDFDPEASNGTATTIFRLAQEGGDRILDLGPGPPIVSSYLKTAHGRRVTCVDRALELTEWTDQLSGESFDVIIVADVFEHLAAPGDLLDLIRRRALLATDGFLVVSVLSASPEGAGQLDSTHLQFFTRETFVELCERHGYFVTRIDRTRSTVGQAEPDRFVFRVESMELARKLAELRERIDVLHQENRRAQDEILGLHNEIQASSLMLDTQKRSAVRTKEFLLGQLERAREEATMHRRRLSRIYNTRVWRIAWSAYSVLRSFRRPQSMLQQLRKGSSVLALVGATPAEKAARMPRAVAGCELAEAEGLRSEYLLALSKTSFGSDARRVAMAVHTLDLSEGRGDMYVAAGLGRYLERIGYEVVYLPRERWYDVPARTQIYLALLDDVDLFRVPGHLTRIAWVRNRTDDWKASRSLPLFDAVLCSSERSLAEISTAHPGPCGILRIGVDPELFEPAATEQVRSGVVATVNLWGRERQLFRALRRCRLDFPLAIYGQERGLSEDLLSCWQGPASFFALPALYRRAALVLDDQNHTTMPYGNVNSRVYESLASGSLVITNATLGFEETGLADVPTYGGPGELDALIHRYLSDPQDARKVATRFQEVVLRDHTFERRARQFDAFVRDLDVAGKASDRVVIAYYPQYPENPYQSMLYSSAAKHSLTAIPVDDVGALVDSSLADLDRSLVLHVHWTAPIMGPGTTRGEARNLGKRFLRQVEALQRQGAQLVWTVHNVLPHECRFPDEEAAFRQELAHRADLIHVMCERTVEFVAPYYALPPEKIRVVPLPNYIDVYLNVVDQPRARAELGLKREHTVFCFLGGIRPYKGVDRLLDAFEAVSRVKPESRLVVVGRAAQLPEIKALADRCEADARIIGNFNRIADADVQLYLNAADVVVLPHRSVLNASSVMLAFSFGRPVIAPAAGCVMELLTPDVSLTFALDDSRALADAMMQADDLKAEHYREAAFRKALAYPATSISEKFCAVVRQLVEDHRG